MAEVVIGGDRRRTTGKMSGGQFCFEVAREKTKEWYRVCEPRLVLFT